VQIVEVVMAIGKFILAMSRQLYGQVTEKLCVVPSALSLSVIILLAGISLFSLMIFLK
jgi:hypothetical protein